jgi:hypothetical protein
MYIIQAYDVMLCMPAVVWLCVVYVDSCCVYGPYMTVTCDDC